jgi:hypothetical protein
VAHRLDRPKIATGRVLQTSVPVYGTYANWTMFVPTQTAGFVSPSPVFLVSLDAHPFGDTADLGLGAPSEGNDSLPDLVTRLRDWVGPFVAIESKSDAGFWIRVSVITDSTWARKNSPSRNPVPVSWVGIETSDQGPFAWNYLPFILSSPVIGGFR